MMGITSTIRGTTPLPDKYDLKATGILKFTKDVKTLCNEKAYSEGSKQITTFKNIEGTDINLIFHYA